MGVLPSVHSGLRFSGHRSNVSAPGQSRDSSGVHVQTDGEPDVRREPGRRADAAVVDPKTELRVRLGLCDARTHPGRVLVRFHNDVDPGRLRGQQSRRQSAVPVRRHREHRAPSAVPGGRVGAHRTLFRVPRRPGHVHGSDDRPDFPAVRRLGVRGRDHHAAQHRHQRLRVRHDRHLPAERAAVQRQLPRLRRMAADILRPGRRVDLVHRVLGPIPVQRARRPSDNLANRTGIPVGKRQHVQRTDADTVAVHVHVDAVHSVQRVLRGVPVEHVHHDEQHAHVHANHVGHRFQGERAAVLRTVHVDVGRQIFQRRNVSNGQIRYGIVAHRVQKTVLRRRHRAGDRVAFEHRSRRKRHQMARHRCHNGQSGPRRFRVHRRFLPDAAQHGPQLRRAVVRDIDVRRVLVRLSVDFGQQHHHRT